MSDKRRKSDWLKSLSDVVEHRLVTTETVEKEVEWFRGNIKENDIPSDGLVLTFDSISHSESLGSTAKFS